MGSIGIQKEQEQHSIPVTVGLLSTVCLPQPHNPRSIALVSPHHMVNTRLPVKISAELKATDSIQWTLYCTTADDKRPSSVLSIIIAA